MRPASLCARLAGRRRCEGDDRLCRLAEPPLIAIAGGVLALVLMLLRRGLAVAGATGDNAPRLVQVGADLPYAVGIAGGMAVWAWRFLPLG